MVSGLVTSPCDQLRIFSGDASMMRIASKSVIGLVSSNGFERNKATLLGRPFGATAAFPGMVSGFFLPGKRFLPLSRRTLNKLSYKNSFARLNIGCPTLAAFLFLRLGWDTAKFN